jgi:simple sugar transport system permease protein
MDLSSINPILLVASIMVSATPILLAAIGEMVVEKSGVLNLGVEGMMITGAVIGFVVAINTGAPLLGFATAAIAGAVLSLAFGVLTQVFLSNQVATGLGLTLVGLGLSSLLGKPYEGQKTVTLPKLDIPILSDLPVVGRMLFSHDIMVYLSLCIVVAVWAFLKYTRAGLILRAVGESHESAHALGYKVIRVRLLAIMFGGACAGLGGAYLSLVRVPQWTEGMTAGAGWIALAIVVFASWRAGRVLVGAYLFGGITVLQLNLQAAGLTWGVQYLSMSPYLITILVLVFISSNRSGSSHDAPANLGQTFHATR